jgi:four helix bundle protein
MQTSDSKLMTRTAQTGGVRATIRCYRDLLIWQKGIDLVERIYSLTKLFPREELYGLSAQLRRSAVSIPSNIAEGFARSHNREYRQFLFISLGSCSELITQMTICQRLKYLDNQKANEIIQEADSLSRMIMALVKKIKVEG